MTSQEFVTKQAALGLTNEQAATVLVVSLRTVEKWRQGARAVPGPVNDCYYSEIELSIIQNTWSLRGFYIWYFLILLCFLLSSLFFIR